MADFDSPWKEALDLLLQQFLQFFFPDIHDDIDWTRPYEVLDKELEKLVREGELGKHLADKLFKVWRKDGQEACVLIHVEVQAQPSSDFAERMYVYNYRIFDRFRKRVVSLAVLADTSDTWHPSEYGYEQWGCQVLLRFRTVKIRSFRTDLTALELEPNPFGLIVLAHLQSQATRADAENRCAWKTRLIKQLFDRGMGPLQIRQLFRLIDWLLELPVDLENRFEAAIHKYLEEKRMPYISTFERRLEQRALEKATKEAAEQARIAGRDEGAREALLEAIKMAMESRCGDSGLKFLPRISNFPPDDLRSLLKHLLTAGSLDELEAKLAEFNKSV